jgi:hypothetical protein
MIFAVSVNPREPLAPIGTAQAARLSECCPRRSASSTAVTTQNDSIVHVGPDLHQNPIEQRRGRCTGDLQAFFSSTQDARL